MLSRRIRALPIVLALAMVIPLVACGATAVPTAAPTSAPPTSAPPTSAPPTAAPTKASPTPVPPTATSVPPTPTTGPKTGGSLVYGLIQEPDTLDPQLSSRSAMWNIWSTLGDSLIARDPFTGDFVPHLAESLIFIQFRPSSLARALKYDLNGDGFLGKRDRIALRTAMVESRSPTVLGPELDTSNVRIWLNGKEERVVRLDQVPEFGDFWQLQYVAQIPHDPRPERGVGHEIRLEMRSTQTLWGQEIEEFDEGSVGYFRP